MEVEFEDEDLDRLEVDGTFDKSLSPALVRAYRRRMQQIRAFVDERDFYANKGAHFEKLDGNWAEHCSVRLNDQFRLILRFKGKAPGKVVVVVCITDYH